MKTSDLRWFHAVNSSECLERVVAHLGTDELLQLSAGVEVDIRLRRGLLILLHDDDDQSDDVSLTVTELFEAVMRKLPALAVLKLDVKETRCYGPLLLAVDRLPSSFRERIWFNADLVSGTSSSRPIEPVDVVSTLLSFSRLGCGLSIGWAMDGSLHPYEQRHIDEMLSLMFFFDEERKKLGEDRPRLLTFPVRHSLVFGDAAVCGIMHSLLDQCRVSGLAEQCFLTFWRARNECIDNFARVLAEFPLATIDAD
jgi:hypothetical protein